MSFSAVVFAVLGTHIPQFPASELLRTHAFTQHVCQGPLSNAFFSKIPHHVRLVEPRSSLIIRRGAGKSDAVVA